jgi:NMD protein affecting ribosome stability and mRNA decay
MTPARFQIGICPCCGEPIDDDTAEANAGLCDECLEIELSEELETTDGE